MRKDGFDLRRFLEEFIIVGGFYFFAILAVFFIMIATESWFLTMLLTISIPVVALRISESKWPTLRRPSIESGPVIKVLSIIAFFYVGLAWIHPYLVAMEIPGSYFVMSAILALATMSNKVLMR